MSRRRSLIRRLCSLLGALVLLAAVLFVASKTFTTKDSEIVARAERLRKGDPPKPAAAIEMLERVVQRSPRHYQAYLELGQAWAELGAYDNAVAELRQAAEVSEEISDAIRAKRLARVFLTKGERYDEAVEVAREISALQPDNPVHALLVGVALYDASVHAQRRLLFDFQGMAERVDDELLAEAVERFVTDLWGSPDVEHIVDQALGQQDVVVQREFRERLLAARETFHQAAEVLEGARTFAGMDLLVSRSYVEMLYRSGRLYDAHIEAGMALQERQTDVGLSVTQAREYIETQAQISFDIGSFHEAAEAYSRLITGYRDAERSLQRFYVHDMYDARFRAGEWEWIFEHVDVDSRLYPRDVILEYAKAAHESRGEYQAAADILRDPFAKIGMGGAAAIPPSLRNNPERRRDILMLCYRVFDRLGDSRRLAALDAVLRDFPGDADARRLRLELNLSEGRVEAALDDAQLLLERPRRDAGDFERWQEIADLLSVQRRNLTLGERAIDIVDDAERWQQKFAGAVFMKSQTRRGGGKASAIAETPVQLFWPQDPALTFAIAEELAARGALESARTNLRRLNELYPRIHEFRYRLATLLVRLGLLESASAEFRELLEESPGDTEVLDLAMRTDKALGRDQEAAELLNRMILQDPLGIGAVSFGEQLRRQDRADQADKLIRRLMRWEELSGRTDIIVLSARIAIALGNFEEAGAILAALAAQDTSSVAVAQLALDLGLATRDQVLIDKAVYALRPLAGRLAPDEMPRIAARYIEAGLYAELLELFDTTLRSQPATRPALRHVARAAIAVGNLDEADDVLMRLDDSLAPLDRFLLLALDERGDEAGRRLRLEIAPPDQRQVINLCLLVRSAMVRRSSLFDAAPLNTLRSLQAESFLPRRNVELLDALLRLAPHLNRLSSVSPAEVVQAPRKVYPLAGPDVEALLAVAHQDPQRVDQALDQLLLLVLTGDREFWQPEADFLASRVLELVPELPFAVHLEAEARLRDGDGEAALELLRPALESLGSGDELDIGALEMFLQAARAAERPEWGVAVAVELSDDPDVALLLADTLRAWGRPTEAITWYETALAARPYDPDGLAGIIQAHIEDKRGRLVEPWVAAALRSEADADLLAIGSRALFDIISPTATTIALLEEIIDRDPSRIEAIEALARSHTEDIESIRELLEQLVVQHEQNPVKPDTDEGRLRSAVLVRAVRTARSAGLNDIARRLNDLSLRLDPGNIGRYREMALLEMEEGNLDTARRYLEVLTFIDLADRDSAKALAQLYADQLGQPIQAAEVVQRAFPSNPPPWAVSILAAQAYLRGDAEGAIEHFNAVSGSPLLTDDVFYDVARIAYASGQHALAASIFQYVVNHGDRDHPERPRANWLLSRRLAGALDRPEPAARPAGEVEAATEAGAESSPATGDETDDGADPAIDAEAGSDQA